MEGIMGAHNFNLTPKFFKKKDFFSSQMYFSMKILRQAKISGDNCHYRQYRNNGLFSKLF